MSTFFYYGHPVLVKEAVQKAVAAFLKRYSRGLVQSLDLREPGHGDRLAEELKTQSFFDEKKLFIVSDALASSPDLADLLKIYWQHPPFDIVLIFQEGDAPEKINKKLFEFLIKQAETVQSFEAVRGAKLQSWVEEKFKEAGLMVAVKAMAKLVAMGTASLQKLEQEIAKIIAYKSYQGPLSDEESKQVKEEEVDKLVQADLIINNFALADAVAAKDRRRGLELLHQHLSAGEDAYAILGLLVYQFRNLLKIKSLVLEPVSYAQLVGVTKLHPFVVKKTYEQAKRFELEDLKKIYGQLFALEVGAKDGRLDLPLSLYCWILGL